MFQPRCTDLKDITLFQVYEILYVLFLWSITFMKLYIFWYFIFLLVPWVKNVTKWMCRTFETFWFLYWKHASLISIWNLQERVIFYFLCRQYNTFDLSNLLLFVKSKVNIIHIFYGAIFSLFFFIIIISSFSLVKFLC